MHRDFDASRRAYDPQRDPVTFTLGGETFTVVPDPTLGDTFDVADAPDISPEDFDPEGSADLRLVRILSNFIKRMVPIEDRDRFDRALYRIPSTHSYVIVECAHWITEAVVGRPTEPPASSSSGRRMTTTGPGSKPRSGSPARSKRSPRGGPTR